MDADDLLPDHAFLAQRLVVDDLTVVGVVDEGLGNTSWVTRIGDGALVVDPERDPLPYQEVAARLGVDIALSADTHLHADFVTGTPELAAAGARPVASAAGGSSWSHLAVSPGEVIDLGAGGWALRVLGTSGHTPEHVAYLLSDVDRPRAVFTGGSLLVGAVARTDLIDPGDTEALTRALFRSIQRELLRLPGDVLVLPTHGDGSFCSAAGGGRRWTTIGDERRANPLLAAPDEDTFVRWVLDQLGSYPPYFLRLREVNRLGPLVYGALPCLRLLSAEQVAGQRDSGAVVVDVRPFADYAAGHVPGSLADTLRPQFASWLGWLVPDPATPLVFVTDDHTDRRELVRQCLNIGYEDIAGELAGGIDAWRAAGGDVASIALVDARRLDGREVVDVRQRSEFTTGHIPGAVGVELGAVAGKGPVLPDGPLVLMCGHGERAATAASLLEAAGRTGLAVVAGGPEDWAEATGQQLTRKAPPASGTSRPTVSLGLKANVAQFSLLVAVNALVGGMIGQERTVLPLLATEEFGLTAVTATLTFIAVFGIVKAATNFLAGTLCDRYGRKPVLVWGWVIGLPVPLLVMWAPSWGWIVATNVLLGVNQGLTWSTTVIMKIDLAGPARRGLAMGLNEAAGYGAVAATALATGLIAERWGLRPEPYFLGLAYAALGLGLSSLAVRETGGHALLEAANHRISSERTDGDLSARQVFALTSYREPALSAASQAGLVNNLNDGLAWGVFPLYFAAGGLSLRAIGVLAAVYPAVWGVGQLLTGPLSDRWGRKWLIAAGMWAQGLAIAAVAATTGFVPWLAALILLGAGTAMVYPTLLAVIGDVAHPRWRASSVGVYRLWRDSGFAAGALLAGVVADALGVGAAIWAVAVLTVLSGIVVAVRMYETGCSRDLGVGAGPSCLERVIEPLEKPEPSPGEPRTARIRPGSPPPR